MLTIKSQVAIKQSSIIMRECLECGCKFYPQKYVINVNDEIDSSYIVCNECESDANINVLNNDEKSKI